MPRGNLYLFAIPLLALCLSGCGRDETARQEAERTAEQARDAAADAGREAKEAGREAGEAVREGARETGAAAREGAREAAREGRSAGREIRTDEPEAVRDTGKIDNAAKQAGEDLKQAGRDLKQGAKEAAGEAKSAGKAAERDIRQGAREVERETRKAGEAAKDSVDSDRPRNPRRSSVNIPAGAVVKVRLNEGLSTDANAVGDRFTATLEEPVVVDGRVAIPKGTQFNGSITTAESSGRLAGRGTLTVQLNSFVLNGTRHEVSSTAASRISGSKTKRDIGMIGGGAAAGAAIGAIAGGGKGAAIGAASGAAAGTGVAAATGKQHVKIPAETVMIFTLQNAVALRG